MGGERTRRAYGARFAFETEEMAGGLRHGVRRCGFHDHLGRHGAPGARPVFCAWDR